MRRTKIICTLGPATESYESVLDLISAGMDVARINMAFGDRSYHERLIERVRKASEELNKPVAILGDLSGAKMRIGELKQPITLHRGETVVLAEKGDGEKRIPVPKELIELVEKVEIIHLADGSIKLKVLEVHNEVVAQVLEGGILTSYKGISFSKLPKVGLTKKDVRDLEFLMEKEVDLIALSFVSSKEDVLKLKEMVEDSLVIAKIERREAVENLEEILKASDGIMIARGDLGVEMSIEDVPVIQKTALRIANEAGKVAITATQMLKSMVVQREPTRAEASDVANAVLDGSDALMLSEETATGSYPIEAVRIMDRIIRRAETMYQFLQKRRVKDVSDAIAGSAARIADELNADAIIVFTRTGSSAIQVSKFRPKTRILVVTHEEKTLRRISVVWGCFPLASIPVKENSNAALSEVVRLATARGLIGERGLIVVTSGAPFGKPGTTNTVRVLSVEDVLREKI